jgi:hypothetical protein
MVIGGLIPLGAGIDVANVLNQLIGSGAADDALRIDVEAGPQRTAQLVRAAIRVAVQLAGHAGKRRLRRGRRAEGTFVGRQFDDAVHTFNLALAGDIGGDLHHFGARLRARGGGGVVHLVSPSTGFA